jgi:hypothetical protein
MTDWQAKEGFWSFLFSVGESCKDNPNQEQGETRPDFVKMNSLFANSYSKLYNCNHRLMHVQILLNS